MVSRTLRASSSPIIVVVEDDHDTRVMLREILEEQGYIVESAANGRVAVELLTKLGHDAIPRLLIVDLNMPVMDGWALLDYVRAHPQLATVPVAVQSADDESTLPDGVSFVLRKPIDVDALLCAVKHYCE